eukprot:scaffold12699_cov54-Attheya_sp.AAC.2
MHGARNVDVKYDRRDTLSLQARYGSNYVLSETNEESASRKVDQRIVSSQHRPIGVGRTPCLLLGEEGIVG